MVRMTMTDLKDIAKFAGRTFPAGYPVDDHVTLSAPEDSLGAALAFFIDRAEHSLAVCLPAVSGTSSFLKDDTLATAILRKLQDPNMLFQVTLRDASYNGDKVRIMSYADAPGNRVVLDKRNFGPAALGLVAGTADGMDSFNGSYSSVTFARHPLIAFRTRHMLDGIHLAAEQHGE